MTPQQADQLAVKITQSWPASRIPPAVWAEDIADLDYALTATTIVQLRRTLERPPSIAEIRQHARTLTERNHPTGTPLPPAENCLTFRQHFELRVSQAAVGNMDAADEVARWVDYADRTTGFGAALITNRMRDVIHATLDGIENAA